MLALNTLTFIFHFAKLLWCLQYGPLPLLSLLRDVSPIDVFFLLGEAQVISPFITLTFLWANTQSELWFISYYNVAAIASRQAVFSGPRDQWGDQTGAWGRVDRGTQLQAVWLELPPPWKPRAKQVSTRSMVLMWGRSWRPRCWPWLCGHCSSNWG